jgi:peroxiredoxin
MAQLESSYSEFTKRGAALIVIAAQKIEGLFKGKEHVQNHKYPFHVLFDETRQVTRTYGVHHAIGADAINIAHPATFIVRADGKIGWIAVSPNQVERPAITDILNAIEKP